MQINEILVDNNLMETTPHKTAELPMQVYTDDFGAYILQYINWHWHNEFELMVVLRGTVRFLVGEQVFVVPKGSGAFVNSGALHQLEPVTPAEETAVFSVLFSPRFIAASDQGNLFFKYVLPVMDNPELRLLVLEQGTGWQREAMDLLKRIYELDVKKPYGYELIYHGALFEIWRLLVTNAPVCAPAASLSDKGRTGRSRMNHMLEFIKTHYGDTIEVSDIARAANISRSECFRCFHSGMGMNPNSFLQKYRLEQAAIRLCTTNETVSQIAVACGFGSSSYFGALFKRVMGKTPLEYRKAALPLTGQ